MANEEHLKLLSQGVDSWNTWRRINYGIRVDLSGANFCKAQLKKANLRWVQLIGANLSGANLIGANLSGANLIGANLSGANLRWANLKEANLTAADLSSANLGKTDLREANLTTANLSSANLREANLRDANFTVATLSFADLSLTQALATNFKSAEFTGACLSDIHTNSATNFDNVTCDYVYLKEGNKERRPHSGNFGWQEFTKLFQKYSQTVDLIFVKGFNLLAFFISLQKLKLESGGEDLFIRAIENKNDGSLVIRINVPADADKEKIEKYLKQEYKLAIQAVENRATYLLQAETYKELDIYYNPTADSVLIEHHFLNQYYQSETLIKALNDKHKKEIAIYHQERKDFLIKLVDKMPEGNVTIETRYTVVDGDYMSEEKPTNSTYNLPNAKFGGGFAGTGGTQTGGVFNDYSSNAAAETREDSDSAIKTILILAANPKTTSPLRLDEEAREIDIGLQRAKKREQFDLKQRWAVRVRDVYQALLDFKPHFVHFSGHGAGQDGLVFEETTGEEKLISSEALANLFNLFSNEVKCVILNACYAKFQAKAIAQHIDYVIGMSQEISDRAAIEFAVGFYSALGAGESIEFAYKLGCNAIQLQGIPEHLTPVLFR
jgi:hypothetical protein